MEQDYRWLLRMPISYVAFESKLTTQLLLCHDVPWTCFLLTGGEKGERTPSPNLHLLTGVIDRD